jgi:hypothetical protein
MFLLSIAFFAALRRPLITRGVSADAAMISSVNG